VARVRVTPADELEARLRDRSVDTWVTPEEQREVAGIVLGSWTKEKSARLSELGGDLCAWAVRGAVPGEPSERDVQRALAGVVSKRHGAALRAYARERRLWPHQAAEQLGVRL
jgi:hypothetical protein